MEEKLTGMHKLAILDMELSSIANLYIGYTTKNAVQTQLLINWRSYYGLDPDFSVTNKAETHWKGPRLYTKIKMANKIILNMIFLKKNYLDVSL